MDTRRVLRITGAVLLTVGAVAAVGILVVRDQISRSRRDLFSPHALRRLAALEYLGGLDSSVELVRVLRDFVAWEPRPLLRRRATAILQRMESQLRRPAPSGGMAG